jgi:hypothetical protein
VIRFGVEAGEDARQNDKRRMENRL